MAGTRTDRRSVRGSGMRRKQTTMLVTIGVVAGLIMMAQLPASTSIESIYPGDTTGEGPPITDSDGDGIPDTWELQFGNSRDVTSLDGRSMTIAGMDYTNSSDGLYDPDGTSGFMLDMDNDGMLNAEEYCWPYDYVSCIGADSTRTGLTGKDPELTSSGLREYLDPSVADTDGDGMPDGYEVEMCKVEASEPEDDGKWECLRFDPLNGSDGGVDYDEDGFDVDRDGTVQPAEYYNNSAEYSYGMSQNWTTELDGLWFGQMEFDEDDRYDSRWRGTDPLNSDSDYYRWTEESGLSFSPGGDDIPDGWEVYFGLNPQNREDNLQDTDEDGWDIDFNGVVTIDATSVEVRDCWETKVIECGGEMFSNLEEYFVSNDDGNWIRSGLKSVTKDSFSGTAQLWDQTTTPAIAHHDVRVLGGGTGDSTPLFIGTKLGVSAFWVPTPGETCEDISSGAEISCDSYTDAGMKYLLPSGEELNDMYVHDAGSGAGFIVLATNVGISIIPYDAWSIDSPFYKNSIIRNDLGEINTITVLKSDDLYVNIVVAGPDVVDVVRLTETGSVADYYSAGSDLATYLTNEGATPQSIAHVSSSSQSPKLYLGTDKGLLIANSPDLQGDFEVEWRFSIYDNEELRNVTVEHSTTSFNVRTLVPDGTDNSHLWIGTGSGVHLLDIGSNQIFHSGTYEHTSDNDANNVYDILPLDTGVFVASEAGMWKLVGSYAGTYNQGVHEAIKGKVVDLLYVLFDGTPTIFGGTDPGRFANIALIDPGNNDSDFDSIPDGWEYAYGLDPTDPYDGLLDSDGDGANMDAAQNPAIERPWTNLDEFLYTPLTEQGHVGTDPRDRDTDGDGLSDGEEYFGWLYSHTEFACHYLVNMEIECDSNTVAADIYLEIGGTDAPLDPTSNDTDMDGLPDGWEIEHRRWIGGEFTGGNNWSLDPTRADDANWDADNDGLSNLCEYQWSRILDLAISGQYFETHGDSGESAEDWFELDPNNRDSDGDTLPDGWEARYSCDWLPSEAGINPMNGSDSLNNPDNDGFDINFDGVLEGGEQLNNYLEYHLKDIQFDDEGQTFPEGLNASLWQNVASWGNPEASFGELASTSITSSQHVTDKGAANPTSSDTDGDGLPDGWEVWFSRWDVLSDLWTLNPLYNLDAFSDPDSDGFTNWEEYNSINPELSEIDNGSKSSPQYYIIDIAGLRGTQPWNRITTELSFGSFVDAEQIAISGWTTDPTNPDTDGDGLLDGIEMIFTEWNESNQLWTLNPLVSDDGNYDSDNDGLTDYQELSLVEGAPDNGIDHPGGVPLMYLDAEDQAPNPLLSATVTVTRVSGILSGKEGRATLAMKDLADWVNGQPPSNLISVLRGISDPVDNDTDGDEMLDGYEYWFTGWDLEEDRWSMNPLSGTDVLLDLDDDSYDCNGDGVIEPSEMYTNLREWQARTYGKYDERHTVSSDLGLWGYGLDANRALKNENNLDESGAQAYLYELFESKLHDGTNTSELRLSKINSIDTNNFNRSLLGISDPTHGDSDSDGLPDGWEYCYSSFSNGTLNAMNDDGYYTVEDRWATNPVNPLDVGYDADNDGWYDRTAIDTPAEQGVWNNRIFTAEGGQYGPNSDPLPFTNMMEYMNNTIPNLIDSDDDSQFMIREGSETVTSAYYKDENLSDGREVFKYGSNPRDNDTDGDMLPDWYEYAKGWNETNDNWSSQLQIAVQWVDVSGQLKPLKISSGLVRPDLSWTWFTMSPNDPTDAALDPDNDGEYTQTGLGWEYTPYNNFQEFFALTDASYMSANAVRLSFLTHNGEPVTEWWQFRNWLLKIGDGNEDTTNYLRMYKMNSTDLRYAKIIVDNDVEFFQMNELDDNHLCRGDWTDNWNIISNSSGISSTNSPNIGIGELPFGWWVLDLDGDYIAEGTDPMNWDTDGDWLVDYFEIHDDEIDGIRGDGYSAIRYDNRNE